MSPTPWPLILLGRMGGIGFGLRVILLMWFNCSHLTPSRFLGGFGRLGSVVSIRYQKWSFKFLISLGRGITLQILFLSMLWGWRSIRGGLPPRLSALCWLAMIAWVESLFVFPDVVCFSFLWPAHHCFCWECLPWFLCFSDFCYFSFYSFFIIIWMDTA